MSALAISQQVTRLFIAELTLPIDKFGLFPPGCSRRVLIPYAVTSPFHTRQVLVKPHSLSLKARGSRGLHPDENKTPNECKSIVAEGGG